MYNILEYIAACETDDFKPTPKLVEWAKCWFDDLGNNILTQPFHQGDCTNEPFACNLCVYETILNEYWKYHKKQIENEQSI
jgi:hypothetical protein